MTIIIKVGDNIKKETFVRSSFPGKHSVTEVVYQYGTVLGFENDKYAIVKFKNHRIIQTEMISDLIPVGNLEWKNRLKKYAG